MIIQPFDQLINLLMLQLYDIFSAEYREETVGPLTFMHAAIWNIQIIPPSVYFGRFFLDA